MQEDFRCIVVTLDEDLSQGQGAQNPAPWDLPETRHRQRVHLRVAVYFIGGGVGRGCVANFPFVYGRCHFFKGFSTKKKDIYNPGSNPVLSYANLSPLPLH